MIWMKIEQKNQEAIKGFLAADVSDAFTTFEMPCNCCGKEVVFGCFGGFLSEGNEVWEMHNPGDEIHLCASCAPKIMPGRDGKRPEEMWLISMRYGEGSDIEVSAWVDETDLTATKQKCVEVGEATGQEITHKILWRATRVYKKGGNQ